MPIRINFPEMYNEKGTGPVILRTDFYSRKSGNQSDRASSSISRLTDGISSCDEYDL